MEGSEDDDDDGPQVPLEELLDDMEALGIKDAPQGEQGQGDGGGGEVN